ncbi:MAG TPA: DUF3090 family protein [Methylomirabilota bacterium]|jgi:uncharacterized repeat protein (TIGR03847 family)|nr:DUF3090 family protein [Methylomirabilota bacterium]
MTPPESFELLRPDHFTCGTVGMPGERVFYIQARQGRRLVTLKSEKEQVRALGQYLSELLDKLPAGTGVKPADAALLEPVDPAWPIASIGLGYDDDTKRIIVVATAVEEEEGREAPTARFAVTREQAAAFASRAADLMKGGRAICPMCSQPKDPGGHVCPRSNGHVVRS